MPCEAMAHSPKYFSALVANLVNVATHNASCPVATIQNATVLHAHKCINSLQEVLEYDR
jgi:hypothetical protein